MKNFDLKRFAFFVLTLSLVLGLAHWLVFFSVTRSLPQENPYRHLLATMLTCGWFCISTEFLLHFTFPNQKIKWLSWISYTWLGFFHLLFYSSLVELVIRLFVDHSFSYWNVFFSFGIGLYALVNGFKFPSVITHEISGPASMQGLSLVQISDLHIGNLHLNAKWLESVVEKVNEQNADILAITGDLVEGSFSEISPQLEILRSAKVKIEKFYITGNHEYINGSADWEGRLEHLGYTVLHNQNKVINYKNAKIMFAGVPDRMAHRFIPSISSLPDIALKTSSDVDYKVLLAHEPASRWDMKTERCDLLLSGHTHGGQIFPFALLVRLVQPVVSGFKKMGDTLVFVHQGTGLWGPPMRWFSRNEIVVFRWK